MKKQAYTKPTMQVVELRQRHQLLNASSGSQQSVQMRSGQIDNEEQVW